MLPPHAERRCRSAPWHSIYVWDGAPAGSVADGRDDAPVRGLTRTRSGEAPDDFTVSAFAPDGIAGPSPVPPNCSANRRALSRPAEGPPPGNLSPPAAAARSSPTVTTGDKPNSAQVDVREQASNTGDCENCAYGCVIASASVEFLEIDNSGRMFVLTENIPNSSKRAAAAFVVRFSPRGVQESVYDIPLQESVCAVASLHRDFAGWRPSTSCAPESTKSMLSASDRAPCAPPPSSTIRACPVLRTTRRGSPARAPLADGAAANAPAGGADGIRLRRLAMAPRAGELRPRPLIPRVPGSTASGDPAISAASLIRRCAGCLIVGGATARSINSAPGSRTARSPATCGTHNDPRTDVAGGRFAPPS